MVRRRKIKVDSKRSKGQDHSHQRAEQAWWRDLKFLERERPEGWKSTRRMEEYKKDGKYKKDGRVQKGWKEQEGWKSTMQQKDGQCGETVWRDSTLY